MFRIGLFLLIILCYAVALFISSISNKVSQNYHYREKFECLLFSMRKVKTSATFSVSNIEELRQSNRVAAISPHMDNNTRITSSEIGFIEEYGLLMNIVPSSILFDIHVNFKLYSSHVILSKLIPNEDQWGTKAFSYQRDVW